MTHQNLTVSATSSAFDELTFCEKKALQFILDNAPPLDATTAFTMIAEAAGQVHTGNVPSIIASLRAKGHLPPENPPPFHGKPERPRHTFMRRPS